MTKIKFLLPILAALAFTGCSTTGEGGVTPARVQSLTKTAVWTTTVLWVKNKPESKPKFQHALDGIQALVDQENWDISALTGALTSSGSDVFTSADASLIVAGTTLILETALGEKVDLSQVVYVKSVFYGSLDGLKLALK